MGITTSWTDSIETELRIKPFRTPSHGLLFPPYASGIVFVIRVIYQNAYTKKSRGHTWCFSQMVRGTVGARIDGKFKSDQKKI